MVTTAVGQSGNLVANAAWQEMQDQLDYAETVAGIRKGLMQARADEGTEAGQFFDTLAKSN